MNCQDFEKSVLALARNSLLDSKTREHGLIHTEGCERCSARLAEERALLAGVRAAAAELAGEEPPERVEMSLLAAFRAQNATAQNATAQNATAQNATMSPHAVLPAPSRPAPSRAAHWLNWKLAAVAAGILILISLMVWRSAGSFKSEEEKQAVSPTPAGAPQAPPSNQAVQPVDREQIVEKKTPKRPRRRASVESSDDEEMVTQFFPLREGEDITSLESLQFVRVELPGSALGDVGLPVDPQAANAPVIADVVLGQDGLARAIRFVR